MAQAKSSGVRKTRKALSEEQKTPRGSFVRLASARMSVAIKALRALGDLSGPAYEYTPADVKKMQEALAAEATAAFRRLAARETTTTAKVFSL